MSEPGQALHDSRKVAMLLHDLKNSELQVNPCDEGNPEKTSVNPSIPMPNYTEHDSNKSPTEFRMLNKFIKSRKAIADIGPSRKNLFPGGGNSSMYGRYEQHNYPPPMPQLNYQYTSPYMPPFNA